MCERTFRGRDAVVRRSRNGQVYLACPACDSGPQFWVRLGNPLLDDHVWSDWEIAIAFSMDDEAAGDDRTAAG